MGGATGAEPLTSADYPTFSKMWMRRWVYHAELYPLIAALGAGCGLCVFMMARTITNNPDVRVVPGERKNYEGAYITKADKQAADGETFKNHVVRRSSQHFSSEIFSSLNNVFGSADK